MTWPNFPCGKYRQTISIYFLYFSFESKNVNVNGLWEKAYHVEFIFSNVPYHKFESKFQRLDFIQKPPKTVGKLLYKNFKVSAIRSISVSFSNQIFQKCKFEHLCCKLQQSNVRIRQVSALRSKYVSAIKFFRSASFSSRGNFHQHRPSKLVKH